MISSLVIKTIRACNLRCDYCYYINSDTQSYGLRIERSTVERLYEAYAEYADGKLDEALFIWHGGEPLLLGKRYFRTLLELQKEHFREVRIVNGVQTNGVLVDDEWIDLFSEFGVGVGVSLDGLRDTHDRHRLTVKGAGTYDAVLNAIKLLRSRKIEVGVLAVANEELQAEEFIRLMRDLQVSACDLLLPMTNHALNRRSTHAVDMSAIGAMLRKAFDAWTTDDNPSPRIRLFEGLIQNALGLDPVFANVGGNAEKISSVAVVETDGGLCMDTEFGEIDRYGLGKEYHLGLNVNAGASFAEAHKLLRKRVLDLGLGEIPSECLNCPSVSACRGSHPGTRFDDSDGSFRHRSAYCDAMLGLSLDVLAYLSGRGLRSALVDPRMRAQSSGPSVHEGTPSIG